MENGYDGRLAAKFSSLSVTQHNEQQEQPDSPRNEINSGDNDSLFQVMKAVEAAEVTIKQQVEENNRLRAELQKKVQELDSYRLNVSLDQRPHSMERPNGLRNESFEAHSSVPPAGNQEDGAKSTRYSSVAGPTGMVVLHRTLEHNQNAARTSAESHSESNLINGSLLPGKQMPANNTAPSPFSSPPTMLNSANRYHSEGNNHSRIKSSGQVLMPITELNNTNSLVKQVRDHEEEITQLRKHLAEYSIKEAQIRNEKYVLEKRIAYMRLAFDQQQQELVDAASKALSYRQDIIEENIRLTYALQDAHQERSTFVSSLLPLLTEYSLQPPVTDAQSIVSNIKVLFRHLQEKLFLTESKLKETQYQLGPWQSDLNNSNFTIQSPSHSLGSPLVASNKNGLEIVPGPSYSLGKVSPSTDDQVASDWDALGRHQSGLGAVVANNFNADDLEKYSPLASRSSACNDITYQTAVTRNDAHPTRHGEEVTSSKQVKFREPVSNSEMDDLDGHGNHNEREPSTNWTSGSSAYTTTVDDPASSYSPNLPPVLEEPSSSFSEAADDDPLPAIEGLQILGEAFPGRALKACGYSINGTTSCNFEWVRHLENGSVNYIDGAKQPNYLVTADDVDTYLAIEVQPLDNRKRKGELVKVFANDYKKITCDPEMHSQIEKTLYSGHSSYKVSLSTGYLDIWEPAVLGIKKEGYSIKCSGPSGVVVTEKFSPNTSVFIPFELPSEFVIISSSNDEYILRVDGSSPDASWSRDTIVLTLRFFILRAGERRKKKKGGLFFNK